VCPMFGGGRGSGSFISRCHNKWQGLGDGVRVEKGRGRLGGGGLVYGRFEKRDASHKF
jgi:hypothetical protein